MSRSGERLIVATTTASRTCEVLWCSWAVQVALATCGGTNGVVLWVGGRPGVLLLLLLLLLLLMEVAMIKGMGHIAMSMHYKRSTAILPLGHSDPNPLSSLFQ